MSCKDVFVLWCHLCLLNTNFRGTCYKDNDEINVQIGFTPRNIQDNVNGRLLPINLLILEYLKFC